MTSPRSWRSRSSCSGRTHGRSRPCLPPLTGAGRWSRRTPACCSATWCWPMPSTWPTWSASACGATTSAPVSPRPSSMRRSATWAGTGCCSRCAPTTGRPWPSTHGPGSRRSTGGAATTATEPMRSSWSWTCVTEHRGGGTMRTVQPPNGPLVLGVETSCDETGVGVVRGHTLLADAVASSVEEHARFGGVVPEVASRAHLEAMVPTIERACETAGIAPYDVDAIAVTSGPGLAGALLVGVAAAKALAIGLGKPIYGVNHLAAHVAVDQLEHGALPEPCLAMLVSGGHSSLLRVEDVTTGVQPLGATIDDAAGEAFDKVARLLGL